MLKVEEIWHPPENTGLVAGDSLVRVGLAKQLYKMGESGSEGGCAYRFVSRGHMVCSLTNNESSHG